ncbi:MAG: hypothetical protein U1E76_07780 [Planctomycetota bacterium]
MSQLSSIIITIGHGLFLIGACMIVGTAVYQGYWGVGVNSDSLIVIAAAGLGSLSFSFWLRIRAIFRPNAYRRQSDRRSLVLLVLGIALLALSWVVSTIMKLPSSIARSGG